MMAMGRSKELTPPLFSATMVQMSALPLIVRLAPAATMGMPTIEASS
jgi:hypothetical protein